MTTESFHPKPPLHEGSGQHPTAWALGIFAMIALTLQLSTFLLFWPVPELGMIPDTTTGTILWVDPDSASADAGILTGDRILHIYHYDWNDAAQQPFLFPLAWDMPRTVPIRLEHDGAIIDIQLDVRSPSVAFQQSKIVALLIGLSCWLTGFVLGRLQRQAWTHASMLGWFWTSVGLLAGIYPLVRAGSYPLTLIVQWILLTVIAPLAAVMHVWFPPRLLNPRTTHWVRMGLLGSILGLNLMGLLIIFYQQLTILSLIDSLSVIMPAALGVSVLISALVLLRTVIQTPIAHLQRQARIILITNLMIGFCWLGLRTLPAIRDPLHDVPHTWLDLLVVAIPLAYLVGAVTPDLYRLDRMLIWLGGHGLTTSILVVGITTITRQFSFHGPLALAWQAVCFVALYQPLYRLGMRLSAPLRISHSFIALEQAAMMMMSTLDRQELVSILCQGLNATFGTPPLGLYLPDQDAPTSLRLVYQQRFHLPERLVPGTLLTLLSDLPLVHPCRTLHCALSGHVLTPAEQGLVYHPGLALWCPFSGSSPGLHGLLVLGIRTNLDLYRPTDIQALQSLLRTAVLAFINSTTYHAQVETARSMRYLYQQVQQIEDATRRALAREIHDEVINVMVRLNIASLHHLLDETDDPFLREELRLILDGEQATSSILREMCERLSPTNLDDPYGLPGALRTALEVVEMGWSGTCHFILHGEPQPIMPVIQREVVRIMREAVMNAQKHAHATTITVCLTYPADPSAMISLTIHDTGREQAHIHPKPGSWGVRSMFERAQAVGGCLTIETSLSAGTTIHVRFPTTRDEEADDQTRSFSLVTSEAAAALTPPTECGLSREYGCTS